MVLKIGLQPKDTLYKMAMYHKTHSTVNPEGVDSDTLGVDSETSGVDSETLGVDSPT